MENMNSREREMTPMVNMQYSGELPTELTINT